MDIPRDRFVRFRELTELLDGLASTRPDLVTLTEIGRSHEDRPIVLATVTNTETGPHHEKPALWIDANIHATEHTGGTAALHLLHRLVTEHGTTTDITRALDTRCFYIVPRMNPDGVELALGERPRYVRSSAREWPRTDQQDGLIPEDVDGDGRILTMRVPDANGAWKLYFDDSRLLVPRDPTEEGDGPYYRLLDEGTIQNFDGVTIMDAPPLAGLDMNRNYPVEWRTEGEQRGAGPYPTSEPEIRAVVQAIVDRPNITAFIQYHTMSGVHLRPYGTQNDEALPTVDLRVFKEIGKKATELTGYPHVSVYHDFRYDPKDNITGVADDWAYDHLGVFAWTTEFWSPMRAAGITDYKFIEWWVDHPLEDDLKMLSWADEVAPGEGYVDWYPYDHPQLGPVELGGWNNQLIIRNPPPHLLSLEVAPHADWAIWHLLISPLLRLRSTEVTALHEPGAGEGTWRVRAVVENTGWLPTNVTAKALERKVVRPIEARLHTGDGITVVGERKIELGQLAGRVGKHSMLGGFGGATDSTIDRAKAEWVVRGPAGANVEVEIWSPRAGVVRTQIELA